jgi:hypothetical protein
LFFYRLVSGIRLKTFSKSDSMNYIVCKESATGTKYETITSDKDKVLDILTKALTTLKDGEKISVEIKNK